MKTTFDVKGSSAKLEVHKSINQSISFRVMNKDDFGDQNLRETPFILQCFPRTTFGLNMGSLSPNSLAVPPKLGVPCPILGSGTIGSCVRVAKKFGFPSLGRV